MAEAVGVAFGALALLRTFKDCIDLLSTISAAKSLGVDCEILNTKLDIEKTLLLQWVDRVRLLDPSDYDRRLDDQRVNKAVSSILASIRLLLSESADLQNRYGLKPAKTETAITPTMSGPRLDDFMQEFNDLSVRIHTTQKRSSVKQRFYWVVRDKEKFSGLIIELSGFVGKLNAVIPAVGNPVDIMNKRDVENIRSFRQVQLVLEAAKEHEIGVAQLAQEFITQRCQERILERLWYRMIDERKNNVAEAHVKTLGWALHPPMPSVEWDDLSEWLRSSSGTYWVSGKAGSGKSTLMKHLYQRPEVQAALRTWASGQRLVMASFFFWYLGTPEQKTQEGLSRSLLYHVLDAEPSLIPLILPTMWREVHKSEKAGLELPSPGEVREAFSKLKTENKNVKFCFFIDGLDEYAGNPMTGIAFIDDLVTSRLLKPQSIHKILGDLVDKASGVFLWVVLACRSLLEGFAAFDYPDELQRRIDELPPELESLFKHMLNKIEPRYQVQGARLLNICYQREAHPEVQSHRLPYFTVNPKGIHTLGLALLDEYDVNIQRPPDSRPLSLDEKEVKCKMLEARMRSRCCGLLEVQTSYKRCFCGQDKLPTCRINGQDLETHHELIDSMVQFMHRSVFEYLSNPEVWKLDCLRLGDNFDANGILSRMNLYLAYVSATDGRVDHKHINQILDLTGEALLYVRRADESFSEATASILSSFSQMTFDLSTVLRKDPSFDSHYPFFNAINLDIPSSKTGYAQLAWTLAVELGMVNTAKQLEMLGTTFSGQERPLLWLAIDKPYSRRLPTFELDASPDMIALLLSKGSDPNMPFTGFSRIRITPWICWLLHMQATFDYGSVFVVARISNCF